VLIFELGLVAQFPGSRTALRQEVKEESEAGMSYYERMQGLVVTFTPA